MGVLESPQGPREIGKEGSVSVPGLSTRVTLSCQFPESRLLGSHVGLERAATKFRVVDLPPCSSRAHFSNWSRHPTLRHYSRRRDRNHNSGSNPDRATKQKREVTTTSRFVFARFLCPGVNQKGSIERPPQPGWRTRSPEAPEGPRRRRPKRGRQGGCTAAGFRCPWSARDSASSRDLRNIRVNRSCVVRLRRKATSDASSRCGVNQAHTQTSRWDRSIPVRGTRRA